METTIDSIIILVIIFVGAVMMNNIVVAIIPKSFLKFVVTDSS